MPSGIKITIPHHSQGEQDLHYSITIAIAKEAFQKLEDIYNYQVILTSFKILLVGIFHKMITLHTELFLQDGGHTGKSVHH